MRKQKSILKKSKKYETVIVGGGISGLSCARRLHDAGEDFLLITKELGGRMLSSKSSEVDYGAAYMTKDYVNILNYVEKREPLKVRDFFFFDGTNMSNAFILKNILHIPKMIKFIFILIRFRWHFLKYRAKAPEKSIKECFEEDALLMKYWKMPARDFIKKHGFEKLDKFYGNPVTSATAFIGSEDVNTLYYIGMFFPIILKTWIVSFEHTVKKFTTGYKDKIKIGSVIKVKKNINGTFDVHSSVGDFTAENVVFAAPQKSLANAYSLPKPFIQQSAYVFHVVGRQEDIYQNKKAIVFMPKHRDVFMLWKQKNGADIIYSKNPKPDLKQYYETYHVVKRVHWDPGMIIPNDELIEQKLEKNLYLASDFNLSLMEDCFLTGLYAANQIIKNSN